MKWSVLIIKDSVHLFGKQIRLMTLEYAYLMPQLLDVIVSLLGMTKQSSNTQITMNNRGTKRPDVVGHAVSSLYGIIEMMLPHKWNTFSYVLLAQIIHMNRRQRQSVPL